jgi:hypothetical protein
MLSLNIPVIFLEVFLHECYIYSDCGSLCHEGKVPKNYWNIERQHNEPVRIYIAFMKENFQKITGILSKSALNMKIKIDQIRLKIW